MSGLLTLRRRLRWALRLVLRCGRTRDRAPGRRLPGWLRRVVGLGGRWRRSKARLRCETACGVSK